MVLVCLPLGAPIGLSPLRILTLCGSERVLVVSTEPPDDLSRGRLSQRWVAACAVDPLGWVPLGLLVLQRFRPGDQDAGQPAPSTPQ